MEDPDLFSVRERVNACVSARAEYGVGLCENVFANFSGTTYDVTAFNTSEARNGTFASWEELCSKIEGLQQELLSFQRILDRTLVCVYALSCEDKTRCLVSE